MNGLIKTEEGYKYRTETRTYNLLEGLTIGAKYTSDLIFIVYEEDIEKPIQVVGSIYGASELDTPTPSDYIIRAIESIITEYERK